MSGKVVALIAKRVLKDSAEKNINVIDPKYEYIDVIGRNGEPTGKKKKVEKKIPATISQKDGKILQKVRNRAYSLDMSLFSLCGVKFGWSSIIGLIPVIGDIVDLLFCYLLVIRKCGQIEGGLPASLRSRMLFNMMLDFGIGLVPIAGDLADAMYRANSRNAWLLEEYLVKKAALENADKNPQAAKKAGVLDLRGMLASLGYGSAGASSTREPRVLEEV